MKKLIKKPVLLLGSLGVLMGLGFVSSNSSEVVAEGEIEWCEFIDHPQFPGCLAPVNTKPCICDYC